MEGFNTSIHQLKYMSPLETVLLYLLVIVILAFAVTCVVILLTTGFKKTGRMSGGLYCIRARPSNGKTYVATHMAIEFLKQGRKVFSNYPIVYNDGIRKLETFALEKEMLLEQNMNGSVIIIDEAYRWFWSRQFKGFTDEWAQYFSTLSQHEISLYYVVQSEDRVDTIMNDCANLFCDVVKTEIPILEMPICFTVTWWAEEIEMQLARTKSMIEPYHTERVWFNRYVAQSFDTKFFGTDRRNPYEGVPWVKYLKETKNFDYQGNYDFSRLTIFKIEMINLFYIPIYNLLALKFKWGIKEKLAYPDTKVTLIQKIKNRLKGSAGRPTGPSPLITDKDLSNEKEVKNDDSSK